MGSKKYLMVRTIFLFIGTIILLFSSALYGDKTVMNNSDKVQDTKSLAFTTIGSASKNLQTILSDFIQEKHLAMLKDPLISSGRFGYEKPDTLYWEITKPAQAGFAVKGLKARRWSNDPNSSQAFDIEREPLVKAIAEQIFAWARADFSWLEKRYRIIIAEETPGEIRLIPLSSHEKKYVSYLLVIFSNNLSQLSSVEIHEKGGDFTRIKFINTLLNQPLPKTFSE
jgi:outer membrane lipoprotein-sorting protein